MVFWVLWFVVLLLFPVCSGVKFVGLGVVFEFGVLWFGDLPFAGRVWSVWVF